MDYEKSSVLDYDENIRDLRQTIPSRECTTFDVAIYPTATESVYYRDLVANDGDELLTWLSSNIGYGIGTVTGFATWQAINHRFPLKPIWLDRVKMLTQKQSPPKSNLQNDPEYSLRLIVAPRIKEIGLYYIPFSRNHFKKIVTDFHLPKSLVPAIVDEKFHFSHPLQADAQDPSWSGFVFRTAPDFFGQNDIALAIAYQPLTGRTNALLLGCSGEDVEDIKRFLKAAGSAAGHPWFLLTLAALLQLRRYKDEDELIDVELETALIQAHLNRTDGHGTRTSSKKKATASNPGDQAYRKLTKNVLELFSRASAVAQDMKLFCKLLDRVIAAAPRVHAPQINTRQMYHNDQTASIKAHIEATKEDILDLSEDNRVATERASLIMSSIWNLIAQEESQKSRGIAQNARIIAALTMVFLPFTFVATLFSMPLLNWRHEPDQKVVEGKTLRYFQYYWITAVCLTLVVLMIWGFWMGWNVHKEKVEEKEEKIKPLQRRSTIPPLRGGAINSKSRFWKPLLGRGKKSKKKHGSQLGTPLLTVKTGQTPLTKLAQNTLSPTGNGQTPKSQNGKHVSLASPTGSPTTVQTSPTAIQSIILRPAHTAPTPNQTGQPVTKPAKSQTIGHAAPTNTAQNITAPSSQATMAATQSRQQASAPP